MSLLQHVGTWAFLPMEAGFQAFSQGRFIGKEQARCLFHPGGARMGQTSGNLDAFALWPVCQSVDIPFDRFMIWHPSFGRIS